MMAHPSSGRIVPTLSLIVVLAIICLLFVCFLSLRDHAYDLETIAEKLPDNFKVCLY